MRMLQDSEAKCRAVEDNRLVSVAAASAPGRRTGREPLQRLRETRRAASNFSHRRRWRGTCYGTSGKSAIELRGAPRDYPIVRSGLREGTRSRAVYINGPHDPDMLVSGRGRAIHSTASPRERRPGSMRAVMQVNTGHTWSDQDVLTGRRAPWCAREEACCDCCLWVSGQPRSGDGPFARGAHYPP